LYTLRGDEASSFALAGKTNGAAYAWLREAAAAAGLSPPDEMAPPKEPPHEGIANGEPYPSEHAEAMVELARYFHITEPLLESARNGVSVSSPVRCWPHHFDLASLIDRGEGRSVGVGMSPGDGSYAWPYFYVTPWPYPPADQLSRLSRGAHWHTTGWTGAVLGGPDVPREGPRDAILAALRESLEACLAM